MGIEIVTFIFGGLLLLTGIIGGGFEAKEVKIPKVPMVPRIVASVAGLIFIIIGIAISGPDPSGNTEQQEVAGPVQFTIFSSLSENAISEQVTISLDGKIAGTLTSSLQHPESMINISVAGEGSYSYSVDGSIVYDYDGTEQAYPCTGQGYINVNAGKEFSLGLSISGETILVTLLEQ